MKRAVAIAFLLVFIVALALAQKGGNAPATKGKARTEQVLVAREKAVWETLKNKDKAADAALLADDFVGLYDTGFIAKADHVKQMEEDFTLRSYVIPWVESEAWEDGWVLRTQYSGLRTCANRQRRMLPSLRKRSSLR